MNELLADFVSRRWCLYYTVFFREGFQLANKMIIWANIVALEKPNPRITVTSAQTVA